MIDISKPLIAATLHLNQEVKYLASLAGERIIDAVEFRADRFFKDGVKHMKNVLARLEEAELPVILTFRQGEISGLTEKERLAIIKELLPGAEAVDIELGSEITARAVREARNLKKTVIISEHNFERTPGDNELEDVLRRSIAEGADIAKIAVVPHAPEDAARLMCFCLKNSKKHSLACISMGEIGKFTRFYGPLFGSKITYGSVLQPIAPGQVEVRELAKELDRYFPGLFFSRSDKID